MFETTILLPPEYNLARASEARARADSCRSPGDRRGYLEMAAIFERRAMAWTPGKNEASPDQASTGANDVDP